MAYLARATELALLAIAITTTVLRAEQGVLVLHVKDAQQKPLSGVRLATEGDGSTGPPTDAAGKTRLRLAQQTKAKSWVSLQLALALLHPKASAGVPTLIIAVFFFSGVQLFFIGMLGEYINAIHSQVRKRPLVIEMERINYDKPVV